MLEDSTYRVEGPPPKKEVSWVLGIYVQNFWAINIYIRIYDMHNLASTFFWSKSLFSSRHQVPWYLAKLLVTCEAAMVPPPIVSTKKTSLSLRNKMVMASNYGQCGEKNNSGLWVVVLMEEILHQLIGSLSHYSQSFVHPRWCRISSINS